MSMFVALVAVVGVSVAPVAAPSVAVENEPVEITVIESVISDSWTTDSVSVNWEIVRELQGSEVLRVWHEFVLTTPDGQTQYELIVIDQHHRTWSFPGAEEPSGVIEIFLLDDAFAQLVLVDEVGEFLAVPVPLSTLGNLTPRLNPVVTAGMVCRCSTPEGNCTGRACRDRGNCYDKTGLCQYVQSDITPVGDGFDDEVAIGPAPIEVKVVEVDGGRVR